MRTVLVHRGICVENIEASARFYSQALGFQPIPDAPADLAALKALTRRPTVDLKAVCLRDARGVTLELLQFQDPPATGARQRRALNQFGLTHFCFWSGHIETSANLVEAHGGAAHRKTLVNAAGQNARVMYCTDPDGVRVEFGERVGESPGFLHSGVSVADGAQTVAFYSSVLGMKVLEQGEMRDQAAWLAPLMELKDVSLSVYVLSTEDGDRIELLHVHQPQAFGSRAPSTPNRFGLTHMTWKVDHLEHAFREAERAGVLPERIDAGSFVCTDPNGVTHIILS